MELSVKELIATVVTKIKAELQQDGKVDILKWWFFMAAGMLVLDNSKGIFTYRSTDVSGQIMFGNDFGMVEAGKVGRPVPVTPLAKNTR